MNKWICLGIVTLVAACSAPQQSTVVTGPNGETLIQINTSGLTCYNSRCLDINTGGSVRGVGRKATRIPSGINVSDGTVTPDEFRRLSEAANLAGGMGSGGDR
ncbi:MAG: hypothetical protein ACR2O2_05140 [Ruegeria sp.]